MPPICIHVHMPHVDTHAQNNHSVFKASQPVMLQELTEPVGYMDSCCCKLGQETHSLRLVGWYLPGKWGHTESGTASLSPALTTETRAMIPLESLVASSPSPVSRPREVRRKIFNQPPQEGS